MNTKKLTYRHCETTHGPPWERREGYETPDDILAQQIWKNRVKSVETVTNFVDSDHHPVVASTQAKLRAMPKQKRTE